MKAQFVITVVLVALIALTSQAAADEGKLTFIQHVHIYSMFLFYSPIVEATYKITTSNKKIKKKKKEENDKELHVYTDRYGIESKKNNCTMYVVQLTKLGEQKQVVCRVHAIIY